MSTLSPDVDIDLSVLDPGAPACEWEELGHQPCARLATHYCTCRCPCGTKSGFMCTEHTRRFTDPEWLTTCPKRHKIVLVRAVRL